MSTRAVTRLTDQSYYQTHSTSTRAVTRLTDQCHYPTQSTSTRAATRLTDQCHYPTHSMLTRTVNRLTDQRYYPAHSMSMKVAAIFSAEIKSFFPNVFSPLLYFLLQANCFHNSDGNLLACAIFSFKINRFVPGHVRLCCCFFSCKRIVFIVATHDFFKFTVNRIFPRVLRLCCFCWVQLNCFIIATAVVGVRDFFFRLK